MRTGALIVGGVPETEQRDSLQKVGSISIAMRLLMTFRMAGVDSVVFVTGEREQKLLEKELAHMGATFLRNDRGYTGMFANVRAGLQYLSGVCDPVLVTPVHVPMFSADTVKALLGCGRKLAVPVFEGERGHPLLLRAEVIPSILEYEGDEGLRGAVQACEYKLTHVEVPDPGILIRSEQVEQCNEIAERHDGWRPVVRVQIARESIFIGPGCRQLLYLIGHTGSVQLACQQMGISYSKAWKILGNIESELGYSVVARRQGGKNGGESYLTPLGAELLAWFEQFEKECTAAVDEVFRRHDESKPKGLSR